MKDFLIVQMIIEAEVETKNMKNNSWDNTITMSNIIRRVKAKNKEEAIGIFILKTVNIAAKNKLDAKVYELDDIIEE